MVGSPQRIREYVARYAAESQCNYLVTSFQWGDLNHQEASYAMELFSSEVIPHFVDAAVTAKTR